MGQIAKLSHEASGLAAKLDRVDQTAIRPYDTMFVGKRNARNVPPCTLIKYLVNAGRQV